MTESITITKSELKELVENLVSEKLGQKPKTKDLKSPHYNTNLLFNDYSKIFKKELASIQEEKGMYQQMNWGKSYDISISQAHGCIRKLVLMSFDVESANKLKISERVPARELYLDMSKLFLRGVNKKANQEV